MRLSLPILIPAGGLSAGAPHGSGGPAWVPVREAGLRSGRRGRSNAPSHRETLAGASPVPVQLAGYTSLFAPQRIR